MNHEKACFVGLCMLIVLFGGATARAWEQSLPRDTLGEGRLAPVKWSAGCGLDSLYLGLRIIGVEADYFDLIERAGITRPEQWVDLGTLERLTREVGAQGLAVKIEGRQRETELRKRLRGSAPCAAILHLRAEEDHPEHLACAFLSREGEIQIAGGTTFQPEVAQTWQKCWSGVALLLSRTPLQKGDAPAVSAPRMEIDKPVLDLGEVRNSSRAAFSFRIANCGTAPLHIKEVLATCSCSKPELTDKLVPPGGSVVVTGSVAIGAEPGPRAGKLTILSDDPKKPRMDVALKWIVGPPRIQLDPANITLSDIRPGSRTDVLVKLTFRRGASAESEGVNVLLDRDCDWISGTLLPDGKTLKVTVSPTWPAGKQSGRVILTCQSARERVVLPVEVGVTPAIIVTPGKLFCVRDPDKQPITRKIGLAPATDADAFRVLGASLHNVPGQVSVKEDAEKAKGWNLEVRLGPFEENTPAFLKGSIAVKTSHGNVTEIQIPVFVSCAGSSTVGKRASGE